MARVAEALKGLTNYLRAENVRLDIEFKEAKVDMAAGQVAQKFKELPPDATPQELQKLQFEVIENAADLGSLDEVLPLISGMYNSAMQTRSLVEAEKHDKAFTEGIARELGIDPGQMTGDDLMKLFNAEIGSRSRLTVEDIEGRTSLKEFNVKGIETFSRQISPLTRQNKLDVEFNQQYRITKMTSDFALRNALTLQENKSRLKADADFGLTGVQQFRGMDFLRAQTTPEQGQLYESKSGAGLFVLEEGGLILYQGDVIPRKSPQSAEDVLDIMMKNSEFFQRQRFNLANVLAKSPKGYKILSTILGRELTATGIQNEDKSGNKIIAGNILSELEIAFGKDDIQTVLAKLAVNEEFVSSGADLEAINQIGLSYLNEKQIEKDQFAKIPKSKYSNITSIGEWNRGSALLSKFVGAPEEYAGIAGSVYNYVNRKLGRPQNTPVTMNDVNSMDFDNQIYLNRQLSLYHKSNLELEAKVPTLDDITTPRKEPENKLDTL